MSLFHRQCHCSLAQKQPYSKLAPSHNLTKIAQRLSFEYCKHEACICSLQWLQTALWERHKIRTVRRTLAQLHEEADISSSGQLRVGQQPVALVYFRAGYAPTDYPTPAEWDIRQACTAQALETEDGLPLISLDGFTPIMLGRIRDFCYIRVNSMFLHLDCVA